MERNDLVDLLYEGAADEQAMNVAVQEFIRRTNSRGVQFGVLHPITGATKNSQIVGFDHSDLETYLEYFALEDPRWPLHLKAPGKVITIPDNLPDQRSFDHSPLVNDLLLKREAYQSMGVMFPVDDHSLLYFYLMRSRRAGSYQKEEVDELAWFLPALKRALSLRNRLGSLESAVGSLSALIDQVDNAIFLVGRSGSLIRANTVGQQALLEGAFLVLRNGQVEPRNHRLIPALSSLIEGVARSGPEDLVSQANTTLLLPAAHGKKALVTLTALHHSVGTVPGAEVALSLKEVAPVRYDVNRLRFVFGLTVAETQLAEGLLEGQNLEALAGRGGLSRETLKAQLSSLYRKTNTHRQGELIVLLTSLLSIRWT